MSDQHQPTAQDLFIERYGLLAEQDGLPRIAGRLIALLIVEDGPFSFSDLAERLQVSRGSISTNTRLLERYGLIERIARAGDRQDYFQITQDPWVRLLEAWLNRQAKTKQAVEALLETGEDLPEGSRARAAAYLAFLDATMEQGRTATDHLREAAAPAPNRG